jgi:hypothetical protein
LQNASEEALRAVFPATDWDLHHSPNSVRSVIPRGERARIVCALPAEAMHLFFRVRAWYEQAPYRICLMQGARELARMDIYQTESLLLSGRSLPPQGGELAIVVSAPGRAAVSYAGSASA